MIISESSFTTLAYKFLLELANKIEKQDNNDEIEVELQDGILTLIVEEGIFILNKQSVLRELWLSSPISGPYHFAYTVGGNWQTKQGVELISLLEKELTIKLKND